MLRYAKLRKATSFATPSYATPRYASSATLRTPNGTAPPTRRPPRHSQRHNAIHTTPSPPIPTAQRRNTPTRQPRSRPILRAQRPISRVGTNTVPPPATQKQEPFATHSGKKGSKMSSERPRDPSSRGRAAPARYRRSPQAWCVGNRESPETAGSLGPFSFSPATAQVTVMPKPIALIFSKCLQTTWQCHL